MKKPHHIRNPTANTVTLHNTLTGEIHEDRKASTEDGVLSKVEKCQAGCRLQCRVLVLRQQLVIALSLVLFVGKVLETQTRSTMTSRYVSMLAA